MNMGRWTEAQKEMQGYKRKLAYGKEVVTLKVAPWEKKEDGQTTGSDQRLDKEDATTD